MARLFATGIDFIERHDAASPRGALAENDI
jgi:hypothetical protein